MDVDTIMGVYRVLATDSVLGADDGDSDGEVDTKAFDDADSGDDAAQADWDDAGDSSE